MKKLRSNKKLKFAVPVPILLVVLGAAYFLVLAPKRAASEPKVNGTLVQLPDEFVVNLAGGHYGKLSVALLLASPPPPPAAGSTDVLPQEPAVRATITDQLTGLDPQQLIDRDARHALLDRLLQALRRTTDEPVREVLVTDLAVQ